MTYVNNLSSESVSYSQPLTPTPTLAGDSAPYLSPGPQPTPQPIVQKPKDMLTSFSDAVMGKVEDVGNWWNGFKAGNETLGTSYDLSAGGQDTLNKLVEKRYVRSSWVNKTGGAIAKGLNMMTGALDVAGGYAKDQAEHSKGFNTAAAAIKSTALIAAGVAAGSAISILAIGTTPAVILGAGTAIAAKYALDKAEAYISPYREPVYDYFKQLKNRYF